MLALSSLHWYIRCIANYFAIAILGIPLGCMFFFLIIFGRIKIRGYIRAIKLVAQGRVIIAANHPSMLETFLIPLLFFPWYLFLLRFFVWSVPDKRLLTPWIRWLFWVGRCATIDRSNPNSNRHTLRELTNILKRKGVVVIHPEAGRTFKGEKFLFFNDRFMRHFVSGLPALAHNTNAVILPLWVSGTDNVLPPGTFFPHFMRSKIIFSFGIPYRPSQQKRDRDDESYILAQAILRS